MKAKIIFLAAAFAASMSAFAQPENPEIRRAAQQLYRKWDAACSKPDFKAMKAMIHPEFIQVDENGNRYDRDTVFAQMEGMMKTMKDMKSEIKVDKVDGTLNDFTAWVTMKASFKVLQKGKWVPMVITEKFAENVVMTSQGYKFKMSQHLPRNYVVPR